jgi:hypothetical protein
MLSCAPNVDDFYVDDFSDVDPDRMTSEKSDSER